MTNSDLKVGEVEGLINTIHISNKIPDSIVLEVLSDVCESMSIDYLRNNQYQHYPKLIKNLISEINLKESSARSEIKNICGKIAELYYFIEGKLNEEVEVRRWFVKKTEHTLKNDDRFLHRIEFLKLSIIRQSIFRFLEEFDISEKHRKELNTVKDEIMKDVILYFGQKTFTLNKRPATPISSIYYHFSNTYNNVPLSILSEFANSLKKYKFYGLTPSDFQVNISESYDSDGLIENIIYDFRIEKEVINGFSKKIEILLKSNTVGNKA